MLSYPVLDNLNLDINFFNKINATKEYYYILW
jgi:hypothetical protein